MSAKGHAQPSEDLIFATTEAERRIERDSSDAATALIAISPNSRSEPRHLPAPPFLCLSVPRRGHDLRAQPRMGAKTPWYRVKFTGGEGAS